MGPIWPTKQIQEEPGAAQKDPVSVTKSIKSARSMPQAQRVLQAGPRLEMKGSEDGAGDSDNVDHHNPESQHPEHWHWTERGTDITYCKILPSWPRPRGWEAWAYMGLSNNSRRLRRK